MAILTLELGSSGAFVNMDRVSLKHDLDPPKLIVEHMHLAVSIPCQYDCVSCSHGAMRYKFSGYQLPIDHLKEFIYFTEVSRYLIKRLNLTGPGEPLLWIHLKEGISLLKASPAIKEIHLVSNGLNINRIDNETWNDIDRVRISLYPAFNKWERLNAALRSHKQKILVKQTDTFLAAPGKGEIAPIPCRCGCTGPMFFDRKVFFYCGPTVFGAAESKGVSVYDYPEMYAEIGPDYLARSLAPRESVRDPLLNCAIEVDRAEKISNYELCKYCFGNLNFKLAEHKHVAFKFEGPLRRPKSRRVRVSNLLAKLACRAVLARRRLQRPLLMLWRRAGPSVWLHRAALVRNTISEQPIRNWYPLLRELWITKRAARREATWRPKLPTT